MAELQLKSRRFRDDREGDWRRLERLLEKAGRGPSRLSPADLIEIPVLYRQALSSLSVARSISLDRSLVDYLEGLCARAYFFVYGVRSRPWDRVVRFFRRDWPEAVQGLWRETSVAALIGGVGAVAAFILVSREPDWFYRLIPQSLAAGRDPAASTSSLAATLHAPLTKENSLDVLAAFLFTHNAQVALFAFALGFALCLLTVGLLVYNGCMLGAFLALFAGRGLIVPAVGWLMIHGVTELFAVTLAGAAGLSMGWAVVFPGTRTRLDAAAHAGRRGAIVLAGVVVMLFIAALLEGYARQLVQPDLARYAVAAATALLWGLYFYLPRPAWSQP
jgi:uncharacterized membrane protein SpoIIM required for sporulation